MAWRTVRLPALPDSFKFATVVDIKCKVGQHVAIDEVVIVVDSKVVMEVCAPEAGTIRQIFVADGDEVPVNAPLFQLKTASLGKDIP